MLGATPRTVLTESRTCTPRPRPRLRLGFLPGPAHRLPASPSEAPRWAEVQGAPTARPHARPRRDPERSALARSRSLTRPYRSPPGLALRARLSQLSPQLSRWRSQAALEPHSSPIGTAVHWVPGSAQRRPLRVLLWGGRRRGPEPRAVVRRASRNYSRTGFLSFIKTQSCTDVIAPAAGRPQSCPTSVEATPTPK